MCVLVCVCVCKPDGKKFTIRVQTLFLITLGDINVKK